MVAKITSNNSLFGTLLYNKNKLYKEDAKLLMTRNMFESADGKFSMKLTLKSFEPYLIANKRTENMVFHASLNPDPKDNLSDEQLSEITEKYLERLGYGNQPYVVFKHTDIDRTHLHLVTIRVNESGKKINSAFEVKRSMAICKDLEQEFNLHPAVKGEKTELPGISFKKLNYKEGDIKRQIGNIAKVMMNNFSFQSIGEYRTLLEICNVSVEEVKGAYNGKKYSGLLYSSLDEEGRKVGVPIKASKFGKTLGYDALQKHFEKSKQSVRTNKAREYLRSVIAEAMKQAKDVNHFKLLLKEKNIGVVFRSNDQNRIYGVTFIDYNNKVVLNGSRLGKEFSANMFDELFKNASIKNIEQVPIEDNNQSAKASESIENTKEMNFNNFGLFDFQQHGADGAAENFARQKEIDEKKRRGKRMGW